MKTDEFVEAALYYNSTKESFINELCSELGLPIHKIKSVEFKTYATDTKLHYSIHIELAGKFNLKAEDLAKTEGMTVITPNSLEIDCGVVDL